MRASREALGLESIPLWQFHHANAYHADAPEYKALMIAAKGLIECGEVQAIGLCNCGVKHVEVARRHCPIASVQNEFNLWEQRAWKGKVSDAKSNEGGVLPYCQENGIVFMPHGAFGGKKARDGNRDLARDFPPVAEMAQMKGVSPHALVLAWMRHRWPCIVHIIGFRNARHLHTLREASQLQLDEKELQIIDGLKKPRGSK